MDFDLSEDQNLLQDAVRSIADRYRPMPTLPEPVFHLYDEGLDQNLFEAGFFEIQRQEGYGPLDAALAVEQLGRLPRCVEAATSMLVAPRLLEESLPRPIALLNGPEQKLGRFLSVARTAIVDTGDDVVILDLADIRRKSAEGIFAYPYGAFVDALDLSKGRRLGRAAVPTLRNWSRIALSIEASAALQEGLEFTSQYVKDRRQFNRPIGSFQAIQHRLAAAVSSIQGLRWMALSAAWSGDEERGALAATFAMETSQAVGYDLHQFNGALGVTLEHPLHFWTWRLRALQSELGGLHGLAAAAADIAWEAA